MVKAENLSFSVGKKLLLHPTTFDSQAGKFHVVMGANGAGKSTLLKLLAGDLEPVSGDVYLNGKPLSSYTKKELALKRAVLSQQYNLSFPISVKDVVLMGRYPHYNAAPSAHDRHICQQALALMEMEMFSERDYTTLSGGEAQKVQMSRVLAQIWNEGNEEQVLFLDEPVSHLDVKYQYQLLSIARQLCTNGTTVVAILHDINLSLAFADQILFMKEGSIRYTIKSANELSTEIIEDCFGIKPTLLHTEGSPRPVVVF